ncbi:MAG: hypothetical protein U9R16_04495 [Campylobacterota bacterium]|nr:hypothetical protein [Campylobacterota bacterium]
MILSVVGFTSLIVLFSGCSRDATTGFKKEPIYAQNMQYTQVGKIIKNNEVVSLINVTYLNSVDSTKWDNDKQNFLVGIYMPDENGVDTSLTMNTQSPVSTKEIKKDDAIYQNIALRNNWADYNIITFNDTEEKTVTLNYSYSNDNNTTISFTKE